MINNQIVPPLPPTSKGTEVKVSSRTLFIEQQDSYLVLPA